MKCFSGSVSHLFVPNSLVVSRLSFPHGLLSVMYYLEISCLVMQPFLFPSIVSYVIFSSALYCA